MKVTIGANSPQTLNSSELGGAVGTGSADEPVLIKKRELARRLSVSERTIDEWVAKRLIPFIAVSPRMYLYDFDEVLTVLRKRYHVDEVQRKPR